MKMTTEKLLEIADVCHFRLTDEEQAIYLKDINGVIANVEKLKEIDCDGITPTFTVLPQKNVLRDDVVEESLSSGEALLNAPSRKDDFFEIPKVMED